MAFAISTINILFQVYTFMLLARILGSWVPELREYKIMQFLAYYTDPYLNLFRKFIPPLGMVGIGIMAHEGVHLHHFAVHNARTIFR